MLLIDRDPDLAQLELLLSRIAAEKLSLIFGKRRFFALHRLVRGNDSDMFEDADIPCFAVALYGARLLNQPPVLAALLLELPGAALQALANKYLDSSFSRPADNALALASKPFRPGSALARDILSKLELSDFMLEEVDRKSAVEVIEPYDVLPPLFDYQNEVRAKSFDLLNNDGQALIIQMPTGAGKTRTAMELVVDLVEKYAFFKKGKSIVWLAHTEELCEQAVESFSAVWATRSVESARVVRLWGSYAPPQAHLVSSLVVAGTSRMHALKTTRSKMFSELIACAAITVIDEAHRALAPTVLSQIKALRSAGNVYLIGLSATPVRNSERSEENEALVALFNGNLVVPALGEDPINELRKRGILSTIERVVLEYSLPDDFRSDSTLEEIGSESDLPESILAQLAENIPRNIKIIDEVVKRASLQAPAIVFCCSVQHGYLLAATLRLRGVRAAVVDCRMRRSERRLVIQKFSKGEIEVLLNFGVLSTGFDAPNVRTVVIARPTKSMILYSQMLGRGLRGPKMGGTDVCTLVDVRDHLGRFGDLSNLYLRFAPYWTNFSH